MRKGAREKTIIVENNNRERRTQIEYERANDETENEETKNCDSRVTEEHTVAATGRQRDRWSLIVANAQSSLVGDGREEARSRKSREIVVGRRW